ncbi:MAG: DUF4038 domain-containing protein [Verrucomicrobia bacterium]|nr:MAG: DUF4038 domain-containing protein [Verrucomicrobiota bacterium]
MIVHATHLRHCFLVTLAAATAAGPIALAAEPWSQIVRVDPARPSHFAREDGSPVFIFNKTAWFYFVTPDPEIVLDRAERLGTNVLRVGLECRYYEKRLGWDAWPWGGTREAPDYTTFNETYWAAVEARLTRAGERGLGINLTLFTSLHLPDEPDSFATIRPYLERVLARLAPHPNIFCWEIHNEHIANPNFQREVARFLRERDPARRPVITSNGTTDTPIWPEAPWLDLAVVHHCTGNQPAYDLRDWYLAIARNTRAFGKPAYNNETGRERRHRNDDPVHRRKQLWIAAAAGTYTTWHSWDGCEGIADPEYVAPGEPFVRPFADWWRSQPFADVAPAHSVLQVDGEPALRDEVIPVVLATPTRDVVLAYLFTRSGGRAIADAQARLRLPAGEYRITWFDPAIGQARGAATRVAAAGLHRSILIDLPGFTDDLALRIDQERADDPVPMPGTG